MHNKKVMQIILFCKFFSSAKLSNLKTSTPTKRKSWLFAFTLVEMLMALLIVSVILSASLPIISQRQKAMASNYNQNRNFPIGGVILWTDMNKLPDNTWMECNGTAIPNGVEYEQARRIFGTNTPDLRNTFAYSTNLNNYLKTDLKNYLQTSFSSVLPKNLIAIWGTTASIPSGWSEAAEYSGVFLRGFGGNSAPIGVLQEGTGIGSEISYAHEVHLVNTDGVISSMNPWIFENNNNTNRHTMHYYRVRPVNKAVRYIKYTNTSSIPDLPEPPSTTTSYRFIAKVRY